MQKIEVVYDAVLEGDEDETMAGVEAALAADIPAGEILKQGLIAAMSEVGDRFENGDYYVPEMLIAARAMQRGMSLLKPHLIEGSVVISGKAVIGTVQGDLHDIGKNLVAMMLEGAGFEVVDAGTDVSPASFVESVLMHKPQLIAMSALLTTTMPSMTNTIEALEEAGVRDQVKVIIGGAPITDAFALNIGADGYAADAGAAVRLAKSLAGVP